MSDFKTSAVESLMQIQLEARETALFFFFFNLPKAQEEETAEKRDAGGESSV